MRRRHGLGPKSSAWAESVNSRVKTLEALKKTARQENIMAGSSNKMAVGGVQAIIRRDSFFISPETEVSPTSYYFDPPEWATKMMCVHSFVSFSGEDPATAEVFILNKTDSYMTSLRGLAHAGSWTFNPSELENFNVPVGWDTVDIEGVLEWGTEPSGGDFNIVHTIVWSA